MDIIISILTGLFLIGGVFGIIALFMVLISLWPMFVGLPIALLFVCCACWVFGEWARGRG